MTHMSPLRPTNIRIDTELLEGMQQIVQRDGVPVSEQVRRGIRMWLESKGVKVKTERPRAATRKRP